jgi:hypothetical protein
VVQNRGAERIIAANDGFRIDRHGPSADDARENATFQKLIADAIDARAGQEFRARVSSRSAAVRRALLRGDGDAAARRDRARA